MVTKGGAHRCVFTVGREEVKCLPVMLEHSENSPYIQLMLEGIDTRGLSPPPWAPLFVSRV